jgi:hypothetical protein
VANTTPKPFVFVLMPFDVAFGDIYKLGIKPAAEGAGAYCERIDEQIFVESILSRIYNQIAKADLIVADMTGRNPNVFYEVGYAHALGKTTVLVTKNSDDIPFDLKHYPHIIYGSSIAGLKDELGRRIEYHLANPAIDLKPEPSTQRLDFTISGILITPNVCIDLPLATPDPYEKTQAVVVGVHNPHDTVANWKDSVLGLILPREFPPAYDDQAIQLQDKTFQYDLGTIGRLLPRHSETVKVRLPIEAIGRRRNQEIQVELIVFTRSGPLSTSFFLKFVSNR